MTGAAPEGGPEGAQLGHLEYVIDEAALEEYRRLVDDYGQYPNLAADDCRALLLNCGGPLPLTTVWQRFHFLRPPVPGRRVQVAGWLRERREREGRTRLRVAAFAVDEIGTEILRSEAAFVVGKPAAAEHPGGGVRESAPAGAGSAADAAVGDGIALGRLALPQGERLADYRRLSGSLAGVAAAGDGNGLAGMAAGWLEGRMGRHYGDDFRWGGRLSLAYQGALMPGDTLAGRALAIECDADAGGVVTCRRVIVVTNQSHTMAAVGESVVRIPSPRLL